MLLLTDLSGVYIEVLSAAAVPSRQTEVARLPSRGAEKKGAKHKDDNEEMDDMVKQSEAALKGIEGLFETMTDGEEMETSIEVHDYHVSSSAGETAL